MPEIIGTVRQIESPEGLHDIEAPALVRDNEYEVKSLAVNTAGLEVAEVTFNMDSNATSGGRVSFNSKGNIAIESLTKHVNLEAKKAIQIKPTTNVIFDSSRRILNDKGNEVHLQFVFDDYKDFNKGEAPEYTGHSGNDEEYAELKVEARTIDMRCYGHGGIALQPCGHDGDGNENKIKFESSRTSALDETATYSEEGGKGLEFGTFNNEHTSLFTGDYRFNKDGMVYAVTRGVPVTDSKGKFDYPTQSDDFKDIVNQDLGVPWGTIVKTAQVFQQLSEMQNPDASDLITCFENVFMSGTPVEQQ